MDSKNQNINASVDEPVESGIIKRVLAPIDVTYSNSMIESWWRAIKHQWLFLHSLDTVETVRKLVTFYVEQHNMHVPHYAFKGQTPDEMFFSTGAYVPEQLRFATLDARKRRRESNLAISSPIAWLLVILSLSSPLRRRQQNAKEFFSFRCREHGTCLATAKHLKKLLKEKERA